MNSIKHFTSAANRWRTKHHISFLVVVLCVIIFPGILSAQDLSTFKNVAIASPNAASLGKFVDIPVNNHTGIPSISIPIYTAENGPLRLPVSLNYHAGGLKVMERASWVGAGWALEAGGMITRSVMGLADELYGPGGLNQTPKSYFRDYGYYDYLYDFNGQSGSVKVLDWNSIASGWKDAEPDIFFFNFNGYSGKFLFRGDRTPVILTQQDIHIEPLLCENVSGCNSSSEYIYGFTITTPDGVRYHFGKTIGDPQDVDPLETTSIAHQEDINATRVPSSWYLHKIESADRQFNIRLFYDAERYSYYSLSLFPQSSSVGGVNLVKNITHGVRLKLISFGSNVINFIPQEEPRQDLSSHIYQANQDFDNVEAKALQRIDIRHEGLIKRSFLFDYGYFDDNVTQLPALLSAQPSLNLHTDKKRLKLRSLQEVSQDLSFKKGAHVFSYYDESSVPRGLTFAQDHWGFYNGAVSNSNLTPALSLTGTYVGPLSGGANRESKWPQMRAGSLFKIQYPTGGHTEFSYGTHNVNFSCSSNCVDTNPRVGGLRIESIKHNEGTPGKPDMVTTYQYSSGVLFSRPNYIYLLRNMVTRFATPNLFSTDGCRYTSPGGPFSYLVSSGSIHPMQTTQGNAYGYREVRVTQPSGGYTIYKYTASGDNNSDVCVRVLNINQCNQNTPEFPPVPVPHVFDRGSLEYEGVFDSGGRKLKETEYVTSYAVEIFGLTGVKAKFQNSGEIWATEYNVLPGKKVLNRVTEKTYSSTGSVLPPVTKISETWFDNANHAQPTRNTLYATDGVSKLKETRYSYIANIDVCSRINSCLSGYLSDAQSLLITYNSSVLACGSDVNCQKEEWQDYYRDLNDERMEYIACLRSSNVNPVEYQDCLADAYAITPGEPLRAIIDLKKTHQDAKLLETSEWRDNLFAGSMLIGYQKFNSDILQIHPGTIFTISTDSPLPANNFAAAHSELIGGTQNTLTIDSDYVPKLTLNYKNGSLVEATGEDGITTSYVWGFNNSLPIAKATGTSFATLNTAYSATGGNLDLLTNQPSLSQAQVNTYNYIPVVGMTSQSDANARKTTFAYDNLAQLKLVSDHENQILSRYSYHYKNGSENVAGFTYATQTDNSITFSSTASYAPGSQIFWDFGTGTVDENGSLTENHTFPSPGPYVVKMVVTHPEYPTTVFSKTITVLPPLSIQITSPPGSGLSRIVDVCTENSATSTCTATVSGGGSYTFIWDFYNTSDPNVWYTLGSSTDTQNFSGMGSVGSAAKIRCRITDGNGNFRYAADIINISYTCSGGGGGPGSCPPDCVDDGNGGCSCAGAPCGEPNSGCFTNANGECICP